MSTSERDHITEACVKRLLKAAETSPKVLFLWDTKLRGFGLRASPMNLRGQQKASWIVQRWSTEANRMDRFFFGEYPTWALLRHAKKRRHVRVAKNPSTLRSNGDCRR